jgi:hypothetical protein
LSVVGHGCRFSVFSFQFPGPRVAEWNLANAKGGEDDFGVFTTLFSGYQLGCGAMPNRRRLFSKSGEEVLKWERAESLVIGLMVA